MNAGPGAAGTVAGLSPAGVPRAPAREPVLLAAAPQRHQRDTASVIVALAAGFDGPDPGAVTRRAQGTGWLLAYLAEFPGQSWQDRWIASGLEDGGPLAVKAIVCQALGIEPTMARIYCVTAGLGALLALDVVRPGLGYMLGLRLSKLLPQLITWRRDPDEDILRAAPASAQSRSTIACRSGASSRVTIFAPEAASATLSDVQYWTAAIATMITSIGASWRFKT